MSEEKRKRRSFWEPDSEQVVNWINNQSDVSRSLHLAIINTIAKYGEGDAIEGLFKTKSFEGQAGQPPQETRQAPVRAPQAETPVEPRVETPAPETAPPTQSPPQQPKAPYDPLAVMLADANAMQR